MRSLSRFAVSLLALAGVLFQAELHATNLAEQPLKASVLAKPAVIFGLDDSGSMDSEVMLYTNDGAFWWDYNAGSGWDASGIPWFNTAGTASAQWRKMVYLFPIGTADGSRVYGDAGNDHFAIAPTAQFAWLRANAYNPLYYLSSSSRAYEAWSPAYVGAAVQTYTDATAAAAKSHPVYGARTLNLTVAVALTSNANETFMAFPGMMIPPGAKRCDHDGSAGCAGGWTDVVADYTVPAGKALRVQMSYYPATFYNKENCGAVDGVTCVSAPDGSKLKRYEIKPGNTFPSGRSYADEMKNFANWWQYARKRKMMLSYSIGEVLEPLTGLRVGVVRMNSRAAVTMYDLDSAVSSSNGRKVAGIFYETNGSGGTPSRETLKYIGDQFMTNAEVVKYACQRNDAFVVTDGFALASAVTPPVYNSATWGATAPYATTHKPSLADIALSYYTNPLKAASASFPAGRVESLASDANTDLHMNTYGMTLGARGTLYQGDGSIPPADGSWPNPSVDRSPTAVDDLWHATINGRGKMYTASDLTATTAAIQAALLDMRNAPGAQAAVAVSTVNLNAGDGQAYLAGYNPAGWTGDLTANPVNRETGVIAGVAAWSANTVLTARPWGSRFVVSSNGSSGVQFTAAAVGAAVNPDSSRYSDAGVVDYLRGNRSGEGTTYRARTSLIGAVINSEPVVDAASRMVYVSSGEGMLHALDADTGYEQWAYVPYGGLSAIGATIDRAYSFKTKLDGQLTLGKSSATGKLLVGGMGAAGRSYFAIDVTSPKPASEAAAAAMVKWTFPGPSQGAYASKIGYTAGKPQIVKTAANGNVVLVTSGYDNGTAIGDGKGRMWMLNAATGAVITEFTTADGAVYPGNEAGLAHVAAYREDDGNVRYAYGGDLLGHLWKFDLQTGTTSLLAVLKDGAGNRQPVMTRPQLTKLGTAPVVMVGTGRLLDITDFGNSAVQSVYAITDGAMLADARVSTTALTRTGGGTITGTVDWSTSRGWYLDLPAGEHVNTDPKYVLGRLFVNVNATGGTNCAQSSTGYVIDVKAAGTVDKPIGLWSVLSDRANATSPLVLQSGDKLFRETRFNDGSVRSDNVTDLTPIAPRKNAWKEIAR